MNNAGRKRKPTKLKELEGNPGKRDLNTGEPEPVNAIPACPAFLRGYARKEWQRISAELYTLGLLTRIDMAALAGYCQAYGRWEDAERQIEKLGKMSSGTMKYLYKTTNGNIIINPLLSVANKAMEQMHKFLTEFGMTPASRSRIVINKSENLDDPLGEFTGDYSKRQN